MLARKILARISRSRGQDGERGIKLRENSELERIKYKERMLLLLLLLFSIFFSCCAVASSLENGLKMSGDDADVAAAIDDCRCGALDECEL